MRRRRRSRGDDLPIRAEINVTSLVDVAFVLLVIFVITAPILAGGIEVDLPRGDVRPLDMNEKPFTLTVTRDNMVYVEDTQMTMAEFQKSFPQLAAAGRFEHIYIRGDSLTHYGAIVKVMISAAQTGKPFSFMVEEQGAAP